MGLSIISFTENGIHLAERISEILAAEETAVFTKCSFARESGTISSARFVEQSITEWAREQMQEKNGLLFIGACGIAVRAIAPCITDKLHDSPVLVMDERGEFVIPILSGHMGGANEIAAQIAEAAGAVPVITTATDINKKFAVDLFAKKNDLHIEDRDGIAKVSSKVLAGRAITMSIEAGHLDDKVNGPEGIVIVSYPPRQEVDVLITTEKNNFDASLCLRPREYAIGMGCKRGKEAQKIGDLIQRTVETAGITENQIFALASIDQKKDEQGLLIWSKERNIPFLTFTAEQLQELKGHFHSSVFVREQVGVDNVCERAALRACGPKGRLVYEKHAEDGMTIAIAKREWRVSFDEE